MSALDDATRLANMLDRISVRGPIEIGNVITNLAMLGLATVKANASGRPGPRRITGDYTRTWNVQIDRTQTDVIATIGTNAVQARRLELGFFDTDSLGRTYNQPPYPHMNPMADRLQSLVGAVCAAAIERAIGA